VRLPPGTLRVPLRSTWLIAECFVPAGVVDRPDADEAEAKSHPPLFLTINDAAALTGLAGDRLRQLARTKHLAYRGSLNDPLFSVAALQALEPAGATPDPPAWLTADAPPEKRKRRPGRPAAPPVYAPDTVVRGNVLDVLAVMPDETVMATVCSPPYWGQRVYADQIRVRWGDGSLVAFGREDTPEDYVAHSLEILKGLHRVLHPEGTVWWNVGDTYMTRTIMRSSSADRVEHYAGKTTKWAGNPDRRTSYGHPYLRDKDLTLVPFQIAIGAQKLGYYVRSIIVWSKQRADDDFRDLAGAKKQASHPRREPSRQHVPEIVADRPVVGHEYILMLAKSEKYRYEAYAPDGSDKPLNVRSVWTFPPIGIRGGHGARFADELPRRCIRLATRENDLVFDPFAGQGTTLLQSATVQPPGQVADEGARRNGSPHLSGGADDAAHAESEPGALPPGSIPPAPRRRPWWAFWRRG
jgi:DNA modification methylase